jgi:chemotaxis-related protein WspB
MLALTFQFGPEPAAVDIRRVREVVPRVSLREVTTSVDWLAGAFVYRGQVVPVVDLHRYAGGGECPPHLSSRIVLVPFAGGLLGLLASRVADLREVPEPQTVSVGTGLGPVIADGSELLRLVDPERLFTPKDRAVLAAVAGGRA